jgi:anti-sigma regulatory factor (Ser/Thr protein kinase)
MSPDPGSYAMFLPPDMASIKLFRNELRRTLSEGSFPSSNIMQIELACDEALTNAIEANVGNHSEESIICTWRIKGSKFLLYILDYGSGYKNEDPIADTDPELLKKDSSLCFSNFIQNIKQHQTKKLESLPYNGSQHKHKNMGKGLKIINTMMDSVKVMFHGEGMVGDAPQGFKVMGSILTLEYDRAKHQ